MWTITGSSTPLSLPMQEPRYPGWTYHPGMTESASIADAVAAGDRALAQGAWAEARARFAGILEHEDHPPAHEGLSWAHWWQEQPEACIAARERAYQGYRDAGDLRGAARMALWIGDDHLWYRGAIALADGWFARARRLLEGLAECPEHGWQAVFDAHVALDNGDVEVARQRAGEAQRVARAHGVVGLEMFAVATDGVARLEQGDIADGLRSLDEAATAALAGEFEDLAPAAWVCCLLLSACEDLHDGQRGAQWCQQIIEFSRRIGAPFVLGNCRSHYGLILLRRGAWSEAEEELRTAVRRLADGPATWHADACARLGDLCRRQGHRREARRAFDRAGEHWRAQLGRAALYLDDGDDGSAIDLVERALRQLPPGSPRRMDALELGVRARLARDEIDGATEDAQELRSIAEAVATEPLLATAELCEARLSAAAGDATAAARRFADAVAAFEHAGAPLESALARLELARTLASSPRSRLAEAEARRSHATFVELGAEAEADQAGALIDELTGTDTPDTSVPLTPRQVEVLQLAADGLTERQMAERLVLSEHTVHRHLANIYTRLGCSSRAAAIAQAARAGLL